MAIEKHTRATAGNEKRAGLILKQTPGLFHRPAGVMRIGANDPRLPQHVDFEGFDDEMALAAGAALIALVSRHKPRVPRQAGTVNENSLASTRLWRLEPRSGVALNESGVKAALMKSRPA